MTSPAPISALKLFKTQSLQHIRGISSSASRLATGKPVTRKIEAHHKPSLGGSSLGHLFSEISATRPGMEGLRIEGQTMSEDHRTLARRVVTWIMGVPVVIGTGIVGWNWVGGPTAPKFEALESEVELTSTIISPYFPACFLMHYHGDSLHLPKTGDQPTARREATTQVSAYVHKQRGPEDVPASCGSPAAKNGCQTMTASLLSSPHQAVECGKCAALRLRSLGSDHRQRMVTPKSKRSAGAT